MTDPSGVSAPGDSLARTGPPTRRGLRFSDVIRLLVTWALTFLALLLTATVLPGFTYTSWWPLAAAAAVAGLVGMIVRPVLVEVAAGWPRAWCALARRSG